MTNAITIPLNKLVPWAGNVRKTAGADTALAELAASIAAHGLLQSLVVRKDKRGKFAVVAGRRRLLALTILAEEGRIETSMEIPCRILSEDDAAAEISLAENAVREQMHPADEFEAFRELIDDGASIADVAARFTSRPLQELGDAQLAEAAHVIRGLTSTLRDDIDALDERRPVGDRTCCRRRF